MANQGQGPSFKTDVHRAKTQRWAEAKSYAYDGDDWGGYDEYDDYGAEEEEEEPVPSQTSTGLRQPGQASQTTRNFGEAGTSATTRRDRSDSFDRGDDQRALTKADAPHGFQGSSIQQSSGISAFQTNSPAPMGTSPFHTRSPSLGLNTNFSNAAHGLPFSGGQSMPVASPSGDYSSNAMRREMSPSQPIQPHFSPESPQLSGSGSVAQFPPRKSSLSQTSSTSPTISRYEPPVASAAVQSTAVHELGTGQPSPVQKLPTFIRPADIYKRMEAERERERRSLDQTQPTMDAVERSGSNQSAKPAQDFTGPQ